MKIYQKLISVFSFCLVGWLMPILPVHAASFDCAKAKTEIENLICSHPELSKLDQEMADAYAVAIKQALDAEVLKVQQRQWLKDLRYCKTANCMQGAYDARIRALQDGEGANNYDTPALQSLHEKDKAVKVKTILAQYPMQVYEGVKEGNRAFCNNFYDALRMASPEISYIEPVLRTDDSTHPALGEYLACDNYEPVSAYVYFVMRELGRRGFRLYRVDMDGHPENGLEEYLYGEDPPSQFNTFSARLVKVNFSKCVIADQVLATPESPVQSGSSTLGFGALVQFQKRFYWYNLSRIGTEGDYYSIDLSAYSPVKPEKKLIEIEKDVFVPYNISNLIKAFSAPTSCNWKVPHNP